MESGRGRAVLVLTLTIVAAACGAPPTDPTAIATAPPGVAVVETDPAPDATFALPDITMRAIADDDLAAMLPGSPEVDERSNEYLVTEAVLDREDQATDIVIYGRERGVAATYRGESGTRYVWIDVLADPGSAHDYLVDLTGDIAKGVDGTYSPSAALTVSSEFPVNVGEEAIGLIGIVGDRYETLIVTRIGRIVVFASEVRPDGADARVAVQYLVDDVLEGVVAVLTGAPVELSGSQIPAYRFRTTLTVSSGTDQWRTNAAGIIAGSSTSCIVDRTTPDGILAGDIIEVEARQWMRSTPGERYEPVGTANAVGRELLGWCPAWPIDAATAGLAGLMTATPALHLVNGVDAGGYQGDAVGLAAALGVDPSTVTVDSFSFWVADGTNWLIELSLVVSGDADALLPLIGSDFADQGQVSVALRHRVFDLDEVEQVVSPS